MRPAFIAALAACLLTLGTAHAQPRRALPRPGVKPDPVIERLNRMTPEQRERALDRLPAERRARVEERLNRLNAMPPVARERLREQYEEFQKLPPEKQQSVRQAFRGLNQLPPERKPEVRRAVLRLRNMTPEQRNSRLDSEAFRSRFSDAERQLIRDLSDTAPPPEPSH